MRAAIHSEPFSLLMIGSYDIQRNLREALSTVQRLYLKYYPKAADRRTSFVKQTAGGLERAPGCQDGVEQQHPSTPQLQAAGWRLYHGGAVLQLTASLVNWRR